MAKFINNSKVATTARRAAAEGLSVEKMIVAIRKVSTEHAKTAGHSGTSGETLTMEQMAVKVSALESYGGGYMYCGEFAVVVGGGKSFSYRCHSVHNYDSTQESDFYDHNLSVVASLGDGSEIKIGHSSNQSSWDVYGLKDGVWNHSSRYDGSEDAMCQAHILYSGCVLYSGIRADVAKECGYDLNDGFHWAFDQAVTAIYS